MRAAVADPAGFNRRVMGYLPRTFFLLVPVFAGIVALFYRRRAFSQHLIFALHLHAAVFLTQALSEGADYTYSTTISEAVGFLVGLFTIAYALLAFKRVYGERWTTIVAKSMGIAVVYAVVGITAVLATLAGVAHVTPFDSASPRSGQANPPAVSERETPRESNGEPRLLVPSNY